MAVVQKSDFLGAVMGSLCLIHCLATPFLFVIQTCSTADSCCEASPPWWRAIDYVFIAISFFAIYWSVKTSSKQWLKYLLWASWIALSLVIINEKTKWLEIPQPFNYIPAVALIALHLYNNKYCQCKDDSSCAAS